MGDAEVQENSRLRVLAETSRLFSEVVTDYETLLARVAERLAIVTSGTCIVYLISRDGVWLDKVAHHHPDPDHRAVVEALLSANRLRVGDGASGLVAKTGVAMVVPVDRERIRALAPPELHPMLEKFDASSLLIMPLIARGSVFGTITLGRDGERLPYTDADRQLCEDLAARAALAIDNARLYHELEQRVAERTAELEATNRELETLSYSISHDLRAPLRAIDGFTRIIGEDHAAQLDDEGRRLLGVVLANTEKMSVLIDALLGFARIGRTPLAIDQLDMTGLARSAAQDVTHEAGPRQIELAVAELPPTRGNAPLMRVVWVNLIGNAVKYTRTRERAVISVGATREDREVIYTVRDNGCGFDMRHANKLFGVFQRLHDDKQYEGVGLGLALVQRIVARHGGRVWAEGALDQGATFSFALPDR